MKRLFAMSLATALVAGVVFLSSARSNRLEPKQLDARFIVKADEKKNPWTSLKANASPEQFQFVVVSDRTGGHRSGVFSRAVQQVNLLQPEFVMSVGDLIEGAITADANRKQWEEFDGYVKQFQMPFFYCPGNHDAQSLIKADVWTERLGRRYYHFKYKECLFVVLNSQDYEADDPKDPPKLTRGLRVGKQQRAYLDAALKENPEASWTFLFIHHPIWAGKDITETGWLEVEQLLAGRKYTVFCGHVHRYQKFIRNGMNYYQLATTGGGSALRGPEYGEFDQVAKITMTKDGPVMANLLLNGILKDDLQPFPSEETGGEVAREALPTVTGIVTLNGKPASGLLVKFTQIVEGEETPFTGSSKTGLDGTYSIYGTRKTAGLKPGKYAVTFDTAAPLVIDTKAAPIENRVPEKYRALNTTPIRVEVRDGSTNRFDLNLEEEKK
jgi:5-hydroxyisourate hydrolase-like protein (transthyretin family)